MPHVIRHADPLLIPNMNESAMARFHTKIEKSNTPGKNMWPDDKICGILFHERGEMLKKGINR